MMSMEQTENILKLDRLTVRFHPKNAEAVTAVDGVSMQIRRGEIFGLVGESGSGKSTLGRTIAGLYHPESGQCRFLGEQVQMIFQDPASVLSPRRTIGQSIMEPLVIRRAGTRAQRKQKALELLHLVGLPQRTFYELPSDFSGGQQQRACIARALISEPDFLIADEPVASLDVSLQAQIAELLRALNRQGMTILFIAHDLSLIRRLCDRTAVMRHGKIVETADTAELFSHPQNDYTKQLLHSLPVPDPAYREL